MSKFVGICAANGRLGRTSMVINLAAATRSFGRSALIMDLHLQKPHVHLQLGFLKPVKTIHDVLSSRATVEQTLHHHASGLVASIGGFDAKEVHVHGELDETMDDVAAISAKSANLPSQVIVDEGRINHVLSDVIAHSSVTYVDMPAATDAEFTTVLKCVDYIVVATSATAIGLHDTKRLLARIEKSCKHLLGVVVIHTGGKELPLLQVQSYLGVSLIGEIAQDELVSHAMSQYYPVVSLYPHSPASLGYKKLAANLLGLEYKPSYPQSVFKYVMRRLGLAE